MSVVEGATAGDFAQAQTIVRDADPDRYAATLFAPAPARPALFALYAFSAEVARVRDAVSNPMPGEIRLQWWRDAIAGEARGDAAASPVAATLEDTIERYRLPRAALLDLVDARVFDLYDDPMPSLADLEGYLGETVSSLIRLASLVLAGGQDPGAADLAGHAGIAYGIAGLLRALPWHARAGRLYLPKDVLDRHGVTRDDVVLGRGGPGFVAALADLRGEARRHLARVRGGWAKVPPAIRPAFLPLALVPGDLARAERPGHDALHPEPPRPPLGRLVRLAWAAARGRV
ncbi:MAG: squalene/phytoene synthase family protein [Methylobacteriaceae bacterium]|nr:squalene/phytoene synthase family protein [Methylobacteriaceae bacterium]